jgi:hypothetical protein
MEEKNLLKRDIKYLKRDALQIIGKTIEEFMEKIIGE